MAVDPRLLAAQRRYMQLQSARAPAVQLSPVTRLNAERAVAQQKAQPTKPLNRMQQAAMAREQRTGVRQMGGGGGGGGGFDLGDIGGTIASAVGKGLQAIDMPRRLVASSIKELADLAGKPGTRLFGNETDEASWSDLWEQAQDPTFGFGTIIGDATGNEWLDRTLGFIGDVATDPLTYLTLGANKFIGAPGRLALGGEAVAKTAAREAAGEAGIRYGEEALARIARRGEHGLTALERADLGLDKAGLRFGLPNANVRIPMTGRLATGGGRALAAARAPFTGGAVGRTARRLGVSRVEAFRPFTESFVTGRGPVSRTEAAATMRGLAERAGATNLTVRQFANRINKTANDLAGREDILHAVEQGVADESTRPFTEATMQLFGAQEAVGVGAELRAHYVPRYLTDLGKEVFDQATTLSGKDLVVPGIGGGSGRLHGRRLAAGQHLKIKGKEIVLGDASMLDIESKIAEQFPEYAGDLFIKDPGVILPRLLKDTARDIGREQFNQALQASGVVLRKGDPRITVRGALDEAETAAARKAANEPFEVELAELAAIKGGRASQAKFKTAQAVDVARTAAEESQAAAKLAREQARTEYAQHGVVAEAAKAQLGRVAAQGERDIIKAEKRLARLDKAAAKIEGKLRTTQRAWDEDWYQRYLKRLQRIEAERGPLRERIAMGRIAAQEEDPLRKRIGRLATKEEELAARVGEGPLGEARREAGETLPLQADVRFQHELARLADEEEIAQQNLEGLVATRTGGTKAEQEAAVAARASQMAGRPVQRGSILSRVKGKLLKGGEEAHVARAEEAVTSGLVKPYAKGLTENDRLAAKRALTVEQLAEPNVLSDEVTNAVAAVDERFVQEFYDTQQALAEALRPYRTANTPEELGGGYVREGVEYISPEGNARRIELTRDIEGVERQMREAYERVQAGIEPARWERSLRSLTQERNKLLKQRDEVITRETAASGAVARMGDMTIAELRDKAARMADTMVRYTHLVNRTPDAAGEAGLVRAARAALNTEKEQVTRRLRYRLAAEHKFTPQERARFGTPEELNREVDRRWERQQQLWDEADERAMGEAVKADRRQQELFESERAKPRRAQERLDRVEADLAEQEENLREAKRELTNAKRRKGGRTVDDARQRVDASQRRRDDLNRTKQAREAELAEADKEWRRWLNAERPGVARPEPVAREAEGAFKDRVEAQLRKATTTERQTAAEAPSTVPSADRSAYDELMAEAQADLAADEAKLAQLREGVKGATNPSRVRAAIARVQKRIETTKANMQELRKQVRGTAEEGGRAARPVATRDIANAYELSERIDELAAGFRKAEADLIRYRRMVAKGRAGNVVGGDIRGLLEESDIAELLARGSFNAKDIESVLKTKVFAEKQDFVQHLRALTGNKRMKYREAVKYAKVKGDNRQRVLLDLLGEMGPVERGRWEQHLTRVSVQDQRTLRDINARLARLGEENAQTNVISNARKALTDDPRRIIREASALPERDLSRWVDPSVVGRQVADIEEQQLFLEGARGAMDQEIGAARRAAAGLPTQEAQQAFEQELARIAAQNQAERLPVQQAIGEQTANRGELREAMAGGKEAEAELAGLGTREEHRQRIFEEQLAPHREQMGKLAGQLSDVQDQRAAWAHEVLVAMPERIQGDLSAVRSVYESAQAGRIEGAVRIAETQRSVAEATDHLKSVSKAKPLSGDHTTAATDYQNGVAQVRAAVEAGAPPEAISLLDDAARISAGLETIDRRVSVINAAQEALKTDQAYEVWQAAVAPGYKSFTPKTGEGGELVISNQLDRALENMENILFRDRDEGLWKVVDTYTRFFKRWATATPGFHLRNALSASFMNASDGVSTKNMIAGVQAFAAFARDSENPNWWVNLPKRYRHVAQDALRAVQSSGAGGAFEISEIGQRAAGQAGGRLKRAVGDNFWLHGSQRAGSRVEGSVRMGMAIDTLLGSGAAERAGGSFAEAVARINRIHFNYNQVGEWDEMARRLIPFWTFLSRNVPLQMQQMLTKPRAYAIYNSFVRNFTAPEGNEGLPQYITQGAGFRLTPGLALMPDVGANQLARSINQLTSPSQLLSQTTPAIKVPLQLATNRNFFYDAPFKANDYQEIPPELRALTPLFRATGVAEDIPGGGTAVEAKYLQSAYDFLPPISWLNRLGGTTEKTADRQQQYWLNLLGIPVRQLTPEVMAAEQRRRKGQAKGEKADETALRKALAKLASAS